MLVLEQLCLSLKSPYFTDDSDKHAHYIRGFPLDLLFDYTDCPVKTSTSGDRHAMTT